MGRNAIFMMPTTRARKIQLFLPNSLFGLTSKFAVRHTRQLISDTVLLLHLINLHRFYQCLNFLQDFWEQFSHHIATILLLSFSWMCNVVRAGTLVLCLHDVVDWLLESAKLFRYMNKTRMCDIMFGSFTIMWVVTRLVMYPYL